MLKQPELNVKYSSKLAYKCIKKTNRKILWKNTFLKAFISAAGKDNTCAFLLNQPETNSETSGFFYANKHDIVKFKSIATIKNKALQQKALHKIEKKKHF